MLAKIYHQVDKQKQVEILKLPLMSSINKSRMQTAFTISIEASRGITTGIYLLILLIQDELFMLLMEMFTKELMPILFLKIKLIFYKIPLE